MRRFVLVAGLAVVAALLAPPGVLAHPSSPGGAGHGYHGRLQQELGLTDDQVNAIREIRQRQRAAARQLWQAMGTAQADIRRLALSGADDATIQAKASEIEGLYAQALQLRVNALREMAPLLSEEQRQKLAQMTPGYRHRLRSAPAPRS